MMEFALLENLQREDLNPMEEAMAYQMLMNELNVTQEQLAKRLGKSRPLHCKLYSVIKPPFVRPRYDCKWSTFNGSWENFTYDKR